MTNRLLYKGNWDFSVRKDFILNPNLSIGAKMLYLAIRAHCNHDGDTAFPSSVYLAKCLGISKDTIFKYANELKESGLLATEQSKSETNKFSHTVYTLYADNSQQNQASEPCRKIPYTGKAVAEKVATKTSHTEEDFPKGEEVVAYWNSKPKLRKVRALTDGRATAMRSRLKDKFFADNFREAIDKVAVSAFCNGANDRRWKATIDFFLRPDAIAKILEGNYDNAPSNNHDPLAQPRRFATGI